VTDIKPLRWAGAHPPITTSYLIAVLAHANNSKIFFRIIIRIVATKTIVCEKGIASDSIDKKPSKHSSNGPNTSLLCHDLENAIGRNALAAAFPQIAKVALIHDRQQLFGLVVIQSL
jgi:hypothetical protein